MTRAATTRAESRHPFVVLAIVLTAVFVQLLDVSIVNVAIPSIQTDIGASYASVQLVVAGYQLAFASLLVTGARLGDIYGRKKLFLTGMSVFTLASAACGLAPSSTALVVARVIQGLGSGLMFPQVLAVIQVTIPPRDRGRAFGIFGATIGLATILGPLAGGLLIKADLFGTDWRMIFLVNVPIGIVALLAALRELPDSKAPDAPRLDLLGAALIGGGLLLLVYPLTEGRQQGWPGWIWLMLAASVPLLVGFVVLQRRKTARDASPLLLMTLFANPSFRAGLLLSAAFFLGIAPFFFSFALYLQIGLGYTALHSGLVTFPFAIGSGLASARSDPLARRMGRSILALGAGLVTLAMAALIVILHFTGTTPRAYEVGPALFVAGIGLGLFVAPLTNLILAGIAGREAGSASGALSTVQQLAGALGVAVIGIILFGLLSGHASSTARQQAGALRAQLTAAGLPPAATDRLVSTFSSCFVRRAQAADPSVTPAGCAPPADAPAPVGTALASAGRAANAQNFQHGIERTLLFEVVVFGAALLLVRLVPPVRPGQLGRPAAAEPVVSERSGPDAASRPATASPAG